MSRSDAGPLGLLRVAALIGLLAGAAGSIGLMFRAGEHTPRFLLVLFTVWVLSPFAVLLCAIRFSRRWSVVTRAALYCVALVVALGSLAAYGGVVDLKPQGSPNAFLFVAVPPASWLLPAVVVPLAALVARRRSGARERE